MTTVLGWVDAQETGAVLTILSAGQASAARAQLKAISELDPRNRGTTYMSAGSVLAAYPEVQQLVGDDFSPSRFVASAADTLFLVAEDRHQQLVAPLLVALLAVVLARGYGRGSDTIIANSTAKLYLGPITDDATRDNVVSLLGDQNDERRRRPRAGAAALQQLEGDRALLIAGSRLPALVTLRPYWC
jgi:type IV secretory pathway TraG/TraD family ATPase VirD4